MTDQRKSPYTTVILAMSADGKIADKVRSPARFGSIEDKAHLETQISKTDAVLLGGGTLRAYHSSLTVTSPALLQQRQQQNLSPQPIHIVCSRYADFNPEWRFFQQSLPRWLMTSPTGASRWQNAPHFERILTIPTLKNQYWSWSEIFQQLFESHIHHLAVLGGGELVAGLLAENLINDLWLTVCPVLLGGKNAPSPIEGEGLLASQSQRLMLSQVHTGKEEVFLHYIVC